METAEPQSPVSVSSPLPDTALPPRLTWRRVFIGDDGLRAGWSLALYILLAVLTSRLVSILAHQLRIAMHLPTGQPGLTSPFETLWQEGWAVVVVLAPALFMALIERRPFARYGLPAQRCLRDLIHGLFWGVVNLSLLIAGLGAMHAISFDGVAEHGALALTTGLEWLAAFFMVGLFEEFLFRGYLQYTVARGVAGIARAMNAQNRHAHAIGFWVAATLFSVVLFVAGHLGNGGETPWGLCGVGLAGLVLAFALWRTGSLWWAIGWHCAWDWAQTCLWGTPDSGNVAHQHILSTHAIGPALLSGGADGPEGSLLIIPALLLAGLVIHLTLPRRMYPLTRDQSAPELTYLDAPSS